MNEQFMADEPDENVNVDNHVQWQCFRFSFSLFDVGQCFCRIVWNCIENVVLFSPPQFPPFWNKDDCQRSNTKSKHINGQTERWFNMAVQNNYCLII